MVSYGGGAWPTEEGRGDSGAGGNAEDGAGLTGADHASSTAPGNVSGSLDEFKAAFGQNALGEKDVVLKSDARVSSAPGRCLDHGQFKATNARHTPRRPLGQLGEEVVDRVFAGGERAGNAEHKIEVGRQVDEALAGQVQLC